MHIFVHGFCDGNDRAASRDYQRQFPERYVQNHETFGSMFNYLKENRTFPKSKYKRALDRLLEGHILDAVEALQVIYTLITTIKYNDCMDKMKSRDKWLVGLE